MYIFYMYVLCMYVRMYVFCMYVRMYVYSYVCVYVFIYLKLCYVHISTLRPKLLTVSRLTAVSLGNFIFSRLGDGNV